MGTESGKADDGQHPPRRSSSWATTSPRRRYPLRCRPLLLLSVAVRRGLLFIVCCCPSSVLVRRALLHGFASLALRLAMGEVDGGGLALVGIQSWTVVGVDCFRGCWLSFAGCCVLGASLLPLLGGRGVVFGGCCRSWKAGTV